MVDTCLGGFHLEGVFVLLVGVFALSFLLEDDSKIYSGFIMFWIYLEYLLIHLFGLSPVALLFIDDSQVEESAWTFLFSEGNL